MAGDLAAPGLRRVRQDPADRTREQRAFAGAEKDPGDEQDGQGGRQHMADAADQAEDGAGHRHAPAAALVGNASRDRARDHGAERPDRHRQACGDGIGAQAVVGIGRHDLHGHADRTEAQEAGRPQPPGGYGVVRLDS